MKKSKRSKVLSVALAFVIAITVLCGVIVASVGATVSRGEMPGLSQEGNKDASLAEAPPVMDPKIRIWDGTTVQITEGAHTQEDPGIIRSPEQLAYAVYYGAGYFKLASDMYMNDWSNFSYWGQQLRPTNVKEFAAPPRTLSFCLDGNGFTIFGLYSTNTSLFFTVTNQATGFNIAFTDVRVEKSLLSPTRNNYESLSSMTAELTINHKEMTGGDEGSVIIGGNNNLAPGWKLNAKDITAEDFSKLDTSAIKGNVKVVQAFDIKLFNGDIAVQPNGSITIRLLVREENRSNQNLKVYYLSEEGVLTDMSATKDGNYLVFNTDHLSKYIILDISEATSDTGLIIGLVCGGVLVLGLGIALTVILVSKKKAKTDESK